MPDSDLVIDWEENYKRALKNKINKHEFLILLSTITFFLFGKIINSKIVL